MTHNVLVLASASLPSHVEARRRLGLPPLRGGPRPTTWRLPGPRSSDFHLLRLEALPVRLAARLAGLMAASGGTASLAAGRRGEGRVALLGGDAAALARFLERADRDGACALAAGEIRETLARFHAPRVLALARGTLPIDGGTLVMGILNVTPDSFSDGGRFLPRRRAVAHALRLIEEGAAIVDIGGESTRPGAAPVPLAEELRRVLPVLEGVTAALARRPGPRPLLSIDTTKAEVARRAAAAGADLVNDISGMTFDPAMPAVVAETGLPVVIQHIRGTPRTMQQAPRYTHLLPEIAAFLRRQVERATRAGVREERIVVDPGIGFGKSRRDNLAILRDLAVLKSLGRPILIGASRKSFLGGLQEPPASGRLEGSLAAEALAIAGGADIIRAHDVKPAVRIARLCAAVLFPSTGRR